MKKLIIFTHFRNSEFEILNFDHVKKLNPDWDIVSVGFEGNELLDNSIYVSYDKYPRNIELAKITGAGENYTNRENWLSCDILIAETYNNFPNYDGYFLYEFDTISNVPIDYFFKLNKDFLGNNCGENIENGGWEWVEYYRKVGGRKNIKLGTAGQNTCMYFSNRAIKHFYDEMILNKNTIYNNMLSEMRIGTIIQQKFKINKIRKDINLYVSSNSADPHLKNIKFSDSYFYHPVKSIDILKECILTTIY